MVCVITPLIPRRGAANLLALSLCRDSRGVVARLPHCLRGQLDLCCRLLIIDIVILADSCCSTSAYVNVAIITAQRIWAVTELGVSVEEAAKLLGCRVDSGYRWGDYRCLPSLKIGRLWKCKISEMDDWVCEGGVDLDDEE